MSLPYFLGFQTPKDPSDRARLVRELSSMGCVRLHHSFWRVPKGKIAQAVRLTYKDKPIVFRRTREMAIPRVDPKTGVYDLGSVSVIAYRVPKSKVDVRVAIGRALLRTPHIQIGQSLHITFHMRAQRFSGVSHRVMSQDRFLNFLREIGADARCINRLRVVYPRSHSVLVNRMINSQFAACRKLTLTSRGLALRIREADPNDLLKLHKVLSACKARYMALKGVTLFIMKGMGIDLRPCLKESYYSIASCRRLLMEKAVRLQMLQK